MKAPRLVGIAVVAMVACTAQPPAAFAPRTAYWDDQRALARELGRSLGMPQWTAWDVYLFYPAGAAWTAEGLPPPQLALAQTAGVVVATKGTLPPLDGAEPLLPRLRDRADVVGEQPELARLLASAAARACGGAP